MCKFGDAESSTIYPLAQSISSITSQTLVLNEPIQNTAGKGQSIHQLVRPAMQQRAAAETQPWALAPPKLGLILPSLQHHHSLWKSWLWQQTFRNFRTNCYFAFPPSRLVLNATCSISTVNEHELTHLFSAALYAANCGFTAVVQNIKATISSARFSACDPVSIFPEQFFLPHLARIENCSSAGLFSLLFPWLEWNI